MDLLAIATEGYLTKPSGGVGEDRTFYSPFESAITENMSSKIVETLSSNVSGNQLSSGIKTYAKSQVTK